MTTPTTDTKHQLSGDWTIFGLVHQVDWLSKSLEKLASAGKKTVHIDCGRIDAIDMSGLQLLQVWMQCAKARGIQAHLINLPDYMQQTIQTMGLGQCFTDNYPDAA